MSDHIPLIDVTEAESQEAVMRTARPQAIAQIETAEQFCVVAINPPDAEGHQTIEATVGASDHALMTMVVTLLGLVGASYMGAQAQQMPTDVARATAQMLGFQHLNAFLREQSQRALAAYEPQTPASDAGAKPTVN
ncbi:hypothetical protein D3C81_1139580 [compost metagenome]